MRLDDAIDRFLFGYFSTRDLSDKTYRAYAGDLRQFAEHAGSTTKIRAIDADVVESYAAHMKQRGLAPASMQRKMVSVRVFFQYWVRREEVAKSPFWGLRLSFGRARRLPKTLTRDEVKRLLRQARHSLEETSEHAPGHVDRGFLAQRNYALVTLLLATGIRVGEAASLTLGSVNLAERTLRIFGKGRRVRLAYLAEPESLKIQREYLRLRRKLRLSSDCLFPNRFGEPLSPQGISNVLDTLRRKARLDRRITPHMLRHTAATLLLQSGVDLRMVQEFLGHASIVSTQRYTHVSPGQLLQVLSRQSPVGEHLEV